MSNNGNCFAAAVVVQGGSGYIIGDGFVLTAGHVVFQYNGDRPSINTGDVSVLSGSRIASGSGFNGDYRAYEQALVNGVNVNNGNPAVFINLDQVFIGVFDGDPGLTFGCPTSLSILSLCRSFIPFALLPNDRVSTGIAENSEPVPGFASDSISSNSSFELGFDSASSIDSNFARFTPSSSVPSPAALPLLAFGLTALGWFRRRKAQVMP